MEEEETDKKTFTDLKPFALDSSTEGPSELGTGTSDDEDEDMIWEQADDKAPSELFDRSAPSDAAERAVPIAVATFSEAAPVLTYLEYPGKVVNYDNAIISLGGTGKLSKTLSSQNDKLEIKFRPNDPYCSPILAERSMAGGYLFRIRRKKRKKTETESDHHSFKCTINLDSLESAIRVSSTETDTEIPYTIPGLCEPHSGTDSGASESEVQIRNKLREQDRITAEDLKKSLPSSLSAPKKKFLKPIPGDPAVRKAQERELSEISDFQIQVLGRVNIAYTFRRGQLCDYQYLPTRLVKGKQVSILNKIFPVFNEPDKNVQFLSQNMNLDLETQNTKTPLFLIPSFFSRIDRPVMTTVPLTEEGQRLLTLSCMENEVNFDELIDAEGFLNPPPSSSSSKKDSDFIVVPLRSKRVIFSHFCNFRDNDAEWLADPTSKHVPQEVMTGAMQDIERRGLDTGGLLDSLRALFEKRPIWSRQALEFETKKEHDMLKYVLPGVSYFAVNGPWRTFWIRLGYDPRNHKESFDYQILDYRLPYVYRNYALHCSRVDERNSKYKPHMVPPKLQMFYQLCDVHIQEVEELRSAMRTKLSSQTTAAEVAYSPKFGFLDEETLEFCRYCISRCVEEVLKQQGKISSLTLPPIELLPAGQVPKDIMRANIAARKSLIPNRRHKRTAPSRGRTTEFMQRSRARRNSGSSSINDLEIDRDEFGKAESEYSEDEMVFDDDEEDSEVDMNAVEWEMVDPDADED